MHRRLTWRLLKESADTTLKLTVMVMFILVGSTVFSLTFRGVDGDLWIEGMLRNLPGGVIGVFDCGMVGRIDDRLREDLEDILLGVVHNDAEEVAGVLTRVGSVPAELDHEAFRAEVSTFIAEHTGRSLAELDLSKALNEMTDIVRRYCS